MPENTDLSIYDKRFIRSLFLAVVCMMIPPAGLAALMSAIWALNWLVAATAFLGGSVFGWVLVFYWIMQHMALLHSEMQQELFRIYGQYDEDGMPRSLDTASDAGEEEPEPEPSRLSIHPG